jgi:hypothetical protein
MAISEAAFEALMQRAGVTLPAASVAELRRVFPLFQAMTARNCAKRDRAAEPAVTFALKTPEDER